MNRVAVWNLRCNNKPLQKGTKEYWQSLKNQAERVLEEITETIEKGIEKKDFSELLDGLVDTRVTLEGLIFLAQMRDEEGYELIMDNNDLKWTNDYDEALEAVEHHGVDLFNLQETVIDGVTYYSVHRNRDNKICKLVGHPRVSLKELL